jgi:hypothetical protein
LLLLLLPGQPTQPRHTQTLESLQKSVRAVLAEIFEKGDEVPVVVSAPCLWRCRPQLGSAAAAPELKGHAQRHAPLCTMPPPHALHTPCAHASPPRARLVQAMFRKDGCGELLSMRNTDNPETTGQEKKQLSVPDVRHPQGTLQVRLLDGDCAWLPAAAWLMKK